MHIYIYTIHICWNVFRSTALAQSRPLSHSPASPNQRRPPLLWWHISHKVGSQSKLPSAAKEWRRETHLWNTRRQVTDLTLCSQITKDVKNVVRCQMYRCISIATWIIKVLTCIFGSLDFLYFVTYCHITIYLCIAGRPKENGVITLPDTAEAAQQQMPARDNYRKPQKDGCVGTSTQTVETLNRSSCSFDPWDFSLSTRIYT